MDGSPNIHIKQPSSNEPDSSPSDNAPQPPSYSTQGAGDYKLVKIAGGCAVAAAVLGLLLYLIKPDAGTFLYYLLAGASVLAVIATAVIGFVWVILGIRGE